MATDALTIMKEKKESLRASSDKPSLKQEFYQSVDNQRKEEVSTLRQGFRRKKEDGGQAHV